MEIDYGALTLRIFCVEMQAEPGYQLYDQALAWLVGLLMLGLKGLDPRQRRLCL